jgi:hypothetical protein
MNRVQLKSKLDEIPANPNFYSFDGKILPDRVILDSSGDGWTVFYLDEYGSRHREQLFTSESEACEHIYKYFLELKERYG